MLTHVHIRWVLLALFVLTFTSAAENTNHFSSLPTYRSTVSQVRVTFFATDENNRPVATLTKSDFAVVDSECVVRNFRSFTPSDETSLDVVAVVDLSESVAPRLRIAIRDVQELVAREQSISDDNVAVLSFGAALKGTFGGTPPTIVCASGCHASDAVNNLLAVKSGGATPLFDALIFASDFISLHGGAGVRPVTDSVLGRQRHHQSAFCTRGAGCGAGRRRSGIRRRSGDLSGPNRGQHVPAASFGSDRWALFFPPRKTALPAC